MNFFYAVSYLRYFLLKHYDNNIMIEDTEDTNFIRFFHIFNIQ